VCMCIRAYVHSKCYETRQKCMCLTQTQNMRAHNKHTHFQNRHIVANVCMRAVRAYYKVRTSLSKDKPTKQPTYAMTTRFKKLSVSHNVFFTIVRPYVHTFYLMTTYTRTQQKPLMTFLGESLLDKRPHVFDLVSIFCFENTDVFVVARVVHHVPDVCMYMHVCIHLCMHVCICVCICIYAYMHVYLYMCIT
jgi:hypothetical protein